MLMCLWFNEVIRFSSCGHISFHYVMWRMEVLKDINMFPLCAHMEIILKAKPKRKKQGKEYKQ
ncbi:hypothetical protein LXL04_017459 [Taraxacum kok-saghyz]